MFMKDLLSSRPAGSWLVVKSTSPLFLSVQIDLSSRQGVQRRELSFVLGEMKENSGTLQNGYTKGGLQSNTPKCFLLPRSLL